jgi:hypothetical protein
VSAVDLTMLPVVDFHMRSTGSMKFNGRSMFIYDRFLHSLDEVQAGLF